MQLDANTYITNRCKKDKNKGRNGLIWENLDGRMELLGHLKVILPIGNCGNRQDQIEPYWITYLKENCLGQ